MKKKGRNAGRTPKYTPERFSLYYPKFKAEGLTQEQIADKMGISSRTLSKYLVNPKYQLQSANNIQAEKQIVQKEAKSRADQIIDAGYSIHAILIEHYKNKGDKQFKSADIKNGEMSYEKCAEMTREALKVCRTEADIKRVFAAIQVNVDNRELNVGGDCQRCSQDIIKIIMGSVDPKTMERIVEAIDKNKVVERDSIGIVL